APLNTVGLKFVVSTMRVSPSQRPRELPIHRRIGWPTFGRPSSGTRRCSWTISLTIARESGVWNSCTLLLYAPGTIGGPVTVHPRHRSCSGRSTCESKLSPLAPPSYSPLAVHSPRLSSARFSPSAVEVGMRPSGGSTIKDVRLVPTTLAPYSHQTWL